VGLVGGWLLEKTIKKIYYYFLIRAKLKGKALSIGLLVLFEPLWAIE
jgi:hypothetical protein